MDGGREALNLRQKYIDIFRTKITPLLKVRSLAEAVSNGVSSEGGLRERTEDGAESQGLPDNGIMHMGWNVHSLA
jgi:hypothetical protein